MQFHNRRSVLAVVAVACLAVVTPWGAVPILSSSVQASPAADEFANGVVVSVSTAGSEAGLSVLKKGGNAMDAAVCTAFALVATYPQAGNLRGGGYMLVHPAPGAGEPVVFD